MTLESPDDSVALGSLQAHQLSPVLLDPCDQPIGQPYASYPRMLFGDHEGHREQQSLLSSLYLMLCTLYLVHPKTTHTQIVFLGPPRLSVLPTLEGGHWLLVSPTL